MKARLVKDRDSNLKLLCKDGSFSNGSLPMLTNLILNFKNADDFVGQDGRWRDSVIDMSLYPGKTVAIVTDDSELVIYSGDAFRECFDSTLRTCAYVSVDEYAQMHNKSVEIVKVYCRENRIAGAHKVGRAWMIPREAPYPVAVRRQRPKTCGPRPAAKKK